MKIKSLSLRDFRGYETADFNFGNFNCLIGPNGIGKTTVLEIVGLLCSSLDFKTDTDANPGNFGVKDISSPKICSDQRLRAFLKKNIPDREGCTGFSASAIFEHEGKELRVELNEAGFKTNELISQPFWWAGTCYFAKFDVDMVNFQLRASLWPKFKKAYEGITGYEVEPEIYTETDLKKCGENADYVIGFFLKKPNGTIHSRRCSAGERKIAKALSQVVNLELSRQPDIILVDNLEIHVANSRHLKMVEEVKNLFKEKQIIATTHSLSIIQSYQPKEDIIDIEALIK